jgi:hypothetical protein
VRGRARRLIGWLCLGAALGGCPAERPILRAYRATARDQLIGGDVAMARVGDYILENDQIRVAILSAEASPGPGVFGGTLVDADLQRLDARFRNGHGMDALAEMFPFINLLSPRPDTMEVSVLEDGSSGERAVVRVEADGAYFLSALGVLRRPDAAYLFPNGKLYLRIRTDYILEPGKRVVKMVSEAWRIDPPPAELPGEDESIFGLLAHPCLDTAITPLCTQNCPAGFAYEPTTGCPTCSQTATGCWECLCAPEGTLDLTHFTDTFAIFHGLLGPEGSNLEPGMIAGDFVFFGGQNDVFAPGVGFDEDTPVFEALFEGRDTFTYPIPFDFMAASGDAVSYGYFTVGPEAGPDPKVLVPVITSSATAFATSGYNCSPEADDDATCDALNRWRWERYFAVGAGDIASVGDLVYRTRGTPTGRLEGVVLEASRDPAKNAHVFVFRDPEPDAEIPPVSIHQLVDQNLGATGEPGLLTMIDADVGVDRVEDGNYGALLSPGTYVVVATDQARTVTSAPTRLEIKVGETTRHHPVLPRPARVVYRITDQTGRLSPAKLSFAARMPDGSMPIRDGLRKPYLGEGRLGNGLRHQVLSATGEGEAVLEPGHYWVTISRGPEHSVAKLELEVESGEVEVLTATLTHEVDTTGWVSGDFHLHAEASFDSGMKLERRVTSAVTEHVEIAVSTDHDVVTDYGPTIDKLWLRDRIQTAIGVELSTLELGHFIAFPLAYDALDLPDHGAPDWTCKGAPGILAELAAHLTPGKPGVRIMAHPRDGFIGHISQLGVDPIDQTRTPALLESQNSLFRLSSCDFDAMELFNSKRFDLIRTPTIEEVVIYNRCLGRIDASTDVAGLEAACPELDQGAALAFCTPWTRFRECAQRFRRGLALHMIREILARTPEEQAANWGHDRSLYTADQDEEMCDPAAYPGAVPEEVRRLPCIMHPGTYDDWMRWLDLGFRVTLTAASDSHEAYREPGMPRTWVRSDAQTPRQIDPSLIAGNLVSGQAMPSYGPFVELRVGKKLPGEVASVEPGKPFKARLRVQTPSWFGVDRIEVYVSGELQRVITLDHGPTPVVDYDAEVELTAPSSDGFVSVIAMGLEDANLLRPVALDVPFGELQLARIATLAFSSLPIISSLFTKSPVVPDFFPVFPIGATNPVLLDADGDGTWSRPGPWPAFCPRACEAPAEEACPAGQTCLTEGVCGIDLTGPCTTGPPGFEQAVGRLGE